MEDVRGAKALKDLVTFYRTAFPDLSNTIGEQVAEDQKVATRGTQGHPRRRATYHLRRVPSG